jgi:tetratricopeptide (TPR) repeat protein
MRFAGWLLCVVLAWPSTAAADKEKAREYYRRAIQHYNLAEYSEALEQFKSAYREVEDPTLLFNIGQCHRQLDDKKQAVRFFRSYLRELPDAPNHEEVRQLIAGLESAIAAQEPPKPAETPPPITLESSPSPEPAAQPAVSSPAPLEATAPAPRKPVYKRWWLWTVVGVVVVGGAAVGLAVGLTAPSTQKVEVSNGTFRPFGLVVR